MAEKTERGRGGKERCVKKRAYGTGARRMSVVARKHETTPKQRRRTGTRAPVTRQQVAVDPSLVEDVHSGARY